MLGIKTVNHGPHRIRATCGHRTIIVDKDDRVNNTGHHREAALKLATQLGWTGIWQGGTVPGINGMVWLRIYSDIHEYKFNVAERTNEVTYNA